MSTLKNTEEIGSYGEDLVVQNLLNDGYKILDRNYRKPWGEIDIVALKDKTYYFIEVKSVLVNKVSRENMQYDLEDRVDARKLKRLIRVISSYIDSKNLGDIDYQIDVAGVYIEDKGKFEINFIKDIEI